MKHTHNIRMCEIDIKNPKYTTITKLVQVQNFIHLFELNVIRHEERERHTIFLCWLLLHLPQTTSGTPSANYWSGLGGRRKSTFPFGRKNSTNWLFSNSPNPQCFREWRHSPQLVSFPIWEFLFWHLWMTHPPRTRVNTCVNVATN